MGIKNKKKLKKLDLLEMPNPERIKLIKEIKQALQQRVAETKLWNSLIKAENLTINEKTINSIDVGIKGLTFSDLINS